jgi:hypothetical protein
LNCIKTERFPVSGNASIRIDSDQKVPQLGPILAVVKIRQWPAVGEGYRDWDRFNICYFHGIGSVGWGV